MGTISFYELNQVERACRDGFSYRPDPAGRNTWRSHLHDVRLGLNWRGDCDDLASTVLHCLCDRLGTSKIAADVYRLKVKSRRCKTGVSYDHMVAAAVEAPGRVWIIGDTFTREPCLIADSPHRLLTPGRIAAHSRVSEGILWRTGVGSLLPTEAPNETTGVAE